MYCARLREYNQLGDSRWTSRGGAVQGIGGTIFEEIVYSDEGNLLSSTFMDYLIPTANEVPFQFELDKTVTPSPIVPGGFKGTGETGILRSPSAIAAAVENALADLSIKITEMPLKPENIWRQILLRRKS